MKAEIPKELYMAVVRVQAAENLDWNEACVRASQLIDVDKFKKAVNRQALRLGKGKLMTQMNKMRETYENKGWDSGYKEGLIQAKGEFFRKGKESVRANEDNFRVPCSICGKPMRFCSNDKNWNEKQEVLYQAFASWHHITCQQAT